MKQKSTALFENVHPSRSKGRCSRLSDASELHNDVTHRSSSIAGCGGSQRGSAKPYWVLDLCLESQRGGGSSQLDMYMYIYILYMCICICVYIYVYVYMCICVYVCMYKYMYIMCICIYVTCAHIWCYVARSFLAFAHTLGTLRCKIFSCTGNLVTEISWKKRVNIWRNSRFGAQNPGRVITTIQSFVQQNWHGIVVPERCYQNRGTVKGRRDVYVHDNVNSVCVYVYGTHVYLYI